MSDPSKAELASDCRAVRELTKRERDVLHLLVAGHSAKEVAQKLSITPGTVETYIDRIRLKTRTRNRAHMVAQAIQLGLLSDNA